MLTSLVFFKLNSSGLDCQDIRQLPQSDIDLCVVDLDYCNNHLGFSMHAPNYLADAIQPLIDAFQVHLTSRCLALFELRGDVHEALSKLCRTMNPGSQHRPSRVVVEDSC